MATVEVLPAASSCPVVEYRKTDAALAELKRKYGGVIYDVKKPGDMEAAKAAHDEIRGYRVDLEKLRVELKAPILEKGRQIDGEAKRITAELEKLEKPIHAQIKAEEDRIEAEKAERIRLETERMERIQTKLQQLRDVPLKALNQPTATVQRLIDEVTAEVVDEATYKEFLPMAQMAKQASLMALATALAQAQQRDADAAELAELRKLKAQLKPETPAPAVSPAAVVQAVATILPISADAVQRRLDGPAAEGAEEVKIARADHVLMDTLVDTLELAHRFLTGRMRGKDHVISQVERALSDAGRPVTPTLL